MRDMEKGKAKPELCGGAGGNGGRRNILELAGDAEDLLSVVLCMK